MNGAICPFSRQSFRNAQAVRAHLKACAAYRQVPEADLPGTGGDQESSPYRTGTSWPSSRVPPYA